MISLVRKQRKKDREQNGAASGKSKWTREGRKCETTTEEIVNLQRVKVWRRVEVVN